MRLAKLLIDGSLDPARAHEAAERMAREVLSNPIIEDYRVEIEA
jgi:phosphoribosylformylglycinamidine (FGAM) synthase PurS component